MNTVSIISKTSGRPSNTRHAANEEGFPVCGAKGQTLSITDRYTTVTCERCRKAAGTAPLGNNDVVLRPGSLLSAKDQRTMHVDQQQRKLARIGRRALAHGDWMRKMGTTAADAADARKSYDKAAKAAAEIEAITR